MIWLLGRVNDVMSVSGHRIPTTEVESVLVSHPVVAGAGMIGADDDGPRHRRLCHPAREDSTDDGAALVNGLRAHVATKVGRWPSPGSFWLSANSARPDPERSWAACYVPWPNTGPVAEVIVDSSVVDAIAAELSSGTTDD